MKRRLKIAALFISIGLFIFVLGAYFEPETYLVRANGVILSAMYSFFLTMVILIGNELKKITL